MALKDCLAKISFDLEDRMEILRLVAENGGNEVKGVEAFVAAIEADIEDARSQLADQGFNVAIPTDERDAGDAGNADEIKATNKGETTETTEAGEQTVIPGAEQDAGRSQAAREADQRREMEARAKQSKMGSTAPQGGAGPLFGDEGGTQTDMFTPASPTPETEVTQGDAVTQRAAKIEDFGEKIGGAQKDKVKGWLARAEEVSDAEIENLPLSKSWPEPDYAALIEEGADPAAVAFIHAARDEIPNKPRQAWKVARWAKQVQILRKFSTDLISGETTMAEVRAVAGSALNGFMGRVALYEAYGHEKSLKNVTLKAGKYSIFKGEKFSPAKEFWVVEVGRKIKAHGETMDDAIANFAGEYENLGGGSKRSDKIKFEIRKWRTGSIFIGKKVGSDWVEVATDPEWDWADARKYLAENQEALEAEYARKRKLPPERGDSNSPRVGKDYRNGLDVTPAMFSETFGFRGVEFGNYVEGPRRQADLNQAFDSLMDLAGILNLPPKAMSLNGSLGLAFGARGSGMRAAAHYEPGNIVINLTKGSGAGSLAHEWWHGMDHYFAIQGGRNFSMITELRKGSLNDGIRPEVVAAFDDLMKLVRLGELKVRSKVADKRKSKPYFSTMPEMTARAFESYVIGKLNDQSASNDYLANILSEDAWNAFEAMFGQTEPSWPYVRASEMPEFREAFDKFFDTLKTEPSTRVNDKGETVETVRLYQRSLDMFYSPLQRALEGASQKQAPAKDWKAIIGKLPGVKKAEIEWLGVEEWLDAQDGQVTREDLAAFVRESQIEVVEDVGDTTSERDWYMSQGEPIYPDDWSEEAEFYMDEAREEAEDRLDPDDPDDVIDEDWIRERAENIAYERYEPREFEATFYDRNNGDHSYDGYWDSDEREYVFYDPISETEVRGDESDVEAWAEELAKKDGANFEARFEEYTEEGGDNYREILLRVPNLHESGKNEPRMGQNDRKRPFVQAAHFEQENVVVHARVKDRTGPNGEKVLFVEEIQSDLASKWREGTESPEVTQRRLELKEEHRNAQMRQLDAQDTIYGALKEQSELTPEWIFYPYGEDRPLDFATVRAHELESVIAGGQVRNIVANDVVRKEMASASDQSEDRSEAIARLIARNDKALAAAKEWLDFSEIERKAHNELLRLGTERSMDPSVPDTPFKEEATYTLMVKRLLRMAAEEGYDSIAWTPGYMQAERWNKAAQSVVEGVEWYSPDTDAVKDYRYVDLKMSGGGNHSLTVQPDGIIEAGPKGANWEGKQLSAVVGPNLAKSILSERTGSVDGQKIVFPDSGYAIAYDQQTKRAVDKIARKHGSKVEVNKSMPDFDTGNFGAVIVNAAKLSDDDILSRYDKKVEAVLETARRAYSDRVQRDLEATTARRRERLASGLQSGEREYALHGLSDEYLDDMFPEYSGDRSNPVWSVQITDDLRAAAMEPMALFKRGQRVDADQEKIKAIIPALQQRLKELMIRGVKVEFDPNMLEQGATEIDRNNGIKVLIGNTLNGVNTVNHEAIHVLRAMNLFTQKEWDVLAAEAEKVWLARYDIAGRYSDLSRDGQIEEAIAQAFADYIDGKKPATTAVGNLFAKVKRFFRGMKEALLGQGVRNFEDIFDLVDEGKVGARSGEAALDGDKRVMYARQPTLNSALGNPSQPNQQVGNTLLTHNTNMLLYADSMAGATKEKWDEFLVQIQDRMLPIKRMEEAVERATGNAVDKKSSAYYAEERYYSKVGMRLDDIKREFTDPVIRKIAKQNRLKNPIKLTDKDGRTRTGTDAVGLWLWARHAQERNARIAAINQAKPDGGSGMTNAQAQSILTEAANGPHAAILDEIGQQVDTLTRRNIDLRESQGLLSAQDAAAWRSMYQHYVPLKGFADPDADIDFTGTGRGFNVRGQESKQALGRSSEAENPLAGLIAQAQEVAIRVEKNNVGKTLLRFMQANPAPDLYEISAVEHRRYFNKATGMVETRAVHPLTRMQEANEFAVKVDGKEYRVKFKDQRMADAMSNIGVSNLNKIMRAVSAHSRYFSMVNTTLNPSFMPVNAFRDIGAAMINLSSFAKGDANKIRAGVLKNWGKAMRGAYRAQNGKYDTQWSKYYREYAEAGGKVSFWLMEQPDVQLANLKRRERQESTVLGRASKLVAFDTDVNPWLNFIENANLAVDNAVRLAAYVTARQAGWSKEDAASLGKNLTVNFNRRGKQSSWMNALFPFTNAAIQGTDILVKAIKNRPVAMGAIVAGIIAEGFLMDALNAAFSDEDDDGELTYDKVPAYVQSRNIILPGFGDENFVTVPIAYGYNVFHNLGVQIGKISRGVKDPGEASSQVLAEAVASMTPFDGRDLQDVITPELLKPVAAYVQNKDWRGRQIWPEYQFNDYGPRSYKSYEGTSEFWKALSDKGNRLTGGSTTKAGWLDVSPEYYEYLWGWASGGAGRFVNNVIDTATSVATGDEVQSRKLPVVRRLNYSTSVYNDGQRFWEFGDFAAESHAAMKTSQETGDPVTDDQRKAAQLYKSFNKAKKERKAIHDRISAVYNEAGLTARERTNKINDLREKERRIYLNFNKRFIDRLGVQGE